MPRDRSRIGEKTRNLDAPRRGILRRDRRIYVNVTRRRRRRVSTSSGLSVWIVLNLHCNSTRAHGRREPRAANFEFGLSDPMMDRPFVRGAADDTSQMYPPHPFRTKPLAGDYRLSACTHRLSLSPFFFLFPPLYPPPFSPPSTPPPSPSYCHPLFFVVDFFPFSNTRAGIFFLSRTRPTSGPDEGLSSEGGTSVTNSTPFRQDDTTAKSID